MTLPKLQRSILSLKSWLFTPGTKSDTFARAAEVHADALIVDLEDAVAPSAKKEAREAALRYLAVIPADHLPCALRINSPDTKFGLDDLQALLNSPANPDYLILPKCGSSATIGLVKNLLREADKSAQIIALIESAKGVGAVDDIVWRHAQASCIALRGCGYGRGPWGGDCLGAAALGAGHASFKPLPHRNRDFRFALFRYCGH